MKYTETKVKAFKARNDYLMTIESVNAALEKYCSNDVPDLIDCMNFGFHTSIAKCIQMYLSAQDNIKRGRKAYVIWSFMNFVEWIYFPERSIQSIEG